MVRIHKTKVLKSIKHCNIGTWMNRNVEEGCGRMWKNKTDFGWIQPSSNLKYPVKRQ